MKVNMRTRVIPSVLCAICFFITHAQDRTTGPVANRGKTYALVVGISRYQDSAIRALQFADKDAERFAQYLHTRPVNPVPEAQIRLLTNESAGIADIYDGIDWLKGVCREGDTAYVYFAGHGDLEVRDQRSLGYLLAWNSPPNNYRNNAIRIEDVNELANTLSLSRNAHTVLITDACRSGKLAGDFHKGKQFVDSQLLRVLNNEIRMTACAADEEAAEGINWGGGRGVFSYYLLMGLNGKAAQGAAGPVRLRDLSRFLDSAFKADRYLKLENHRQTPNTDGHPDFPLSYVGLVQHTDVAVAEAEVELPVGLQGFSKVSAQPIDYFFQLMRRKPVEQLLDVGRDIPMNADSLSFLLLEACLAHQRRLDNERDTAQFTRRRDEAYEFASIDTLELLLQQLRQNSSLRSRFAQRLILSVHEKGQQMVNAYLSGDIAELEKRQYYSGNGRSYDRYLGLLRVVRGMIPEGHHLARLMEVQDEYLSGLSCRLLLPLTKDTDSLFQKAFFHQRRALQLEPYAAYIHNELGNLQLRKGNEDSAGYHFALAATLAPTWAIPWSNRMRLQLMAGRVSKAREAYRIADSLQPGLAYVQMNAGLMMEQEKRWLDAESQYLKAIDGNNFHYLPFERLGMLYIQRGDYALADQFLHEARIRKESFSLNESDFKFGVELAGMAPPGDLQPVMDSCDYANISSGSPFEAFDKLANGIRLVKGASAGNAEGMELLRQALQADANLPFAHHYLGKAHYAQRQWKEAETYLRKAVTGYRNDSSLKRYMKSVFTGNNMAHVDNCLPRMIVNSRYDLLEDYYMLGSIYEQTSQANAALRVYDSVIQLENRRQDEQAAYHGFGDGQHSVPEEFEALLVRFEKPIRKGGTIKAARLLESMERFQEAEKILLDQVAANRKAGDRRQAALNAKTPGTWQIPGGIPYNFYWLNINRDMESETWNFYQRMMDRFPRDPFWKEKAGRFLYRRLKMTFDGMPVDQYRPFYAWTQQSAYPWTGDDAPKLTPSEEFNLPGSAERVVIDMPSYDPVLEARRCLLEFVQLSGEIRPSATIMESLANLNAWSGHTSDAMYWYAKAVMAKPDNRTLRNKYISYLVAFDEFPAARDQLVILNQRKQASREQRLQLADYQALSGAFQQADVVLRGFRPLNQAERQEYFSVMARMQWLKGNPSRALAYLRDSLKAAIPTDQDDETVLMEKRDLNDFRSYSMARMYMMLRNESAALQALAIAVKNGFSYRNILEVDEVWHSLRSADSWKQVLDALPPAIDYGSSDMIHFSNPIQYIIPGFVRLY
jgi:tetratricopeptide (TPR) repeat protein